MTNFLSTKMTLMITVLALTFSAGVGGTLLAEEINQNWMGNDELSDVEAIVVQLVEDINLLTVEIDGLNAEIDTLETDATNLQAQVTSLIAERDLLQVELVAANNDLLQFKVDICAVIDTLPSSQRDKYNEWCGVYGEEPEPGNYLEGTYTATVFATEYSSYNDEDYISVVITVDVDGFITAIVFEAFATGGLSKLDPTYASWLGWDTQSVDVADAIIAAQGWGVLDDIDGVSGASIDIDGFELVFNTAIADAIAP